MHWLHLLNSNLKTKDLGFQSIIKCSLYPCSKSCLMHLLIARVVSNLNNILIGHMMSTTEWLFAIKFFLLNFLKPNRIIELYYPRWIRQSYGMFKNLLVIFGLCFFYPFSCFKEKMSNPLSECQILHLNIGSPKKTLIT